MRVRWWAALALVACSGSDEVVEPTACDAPISAVVGTGAEAYVPLADGDLVTFVHGPQGGWHVETAAIVEGSSQTVSATPTITVPSLAGLQIAGDQQPQFLAQAEYDEATCSGQVWGVRAFVDEPDPPPSGFENMLEFLCSLEGEELELTISVADLDPDAEGEAAATSTVKVIAQPDSSDAAACASF